MTFPPDGPFRGSAAVAAGLVTRGALRGPRFQRLFPDVYALAHLKDDLLLRSRAAGVLVAGRGAVAGYSAAELLGASSGPPGAPAEVLLTGPRCQSYRCEGLRVHRDRIGPDEITRVGGVAVTTPERTAFDLARWAPTLTERVAAVDALAHERGVDLADVTALRHRHLGARHGGQVAEVLNLIRRLRDHGIGVILISHRMPDVFAVADRIAVLRRGRMVASKEIKESSPEEVTGLITGAIQTA